MDPNKLQLDIMGMKIHTLCAHGEPENVSGSMVNFTKSDFQM